MPSNIIRKARRASIRDVARAASVSTSTVSLVLNRNDTVRPETRQRVEEAMSRLGYRPLAAGRPIVRGRGHTIALIYPPESLQDRRLAVLSQGWTDGICASLVGGGVRICSVVYRGDVDTPGLEVLVQCDADGRRVLDGAIVVGNFKEPTCTDLMVSHGVPLVVLNRRPEFGEYGHVSIDNYGSMLQAIDYLVDLGHRRIAMITTPGSYVYVSERAKGAADAFARHGLSPVFSRPLGPYDPDEVVESACRDVIASGATAVFTGDYTARRCFAFWHRMGVKVPEDLSILGYDALGLPTSTGLRLTSVGYDKHGMGELAAEALLEILQDKRLVRHRSARMATHIVAGDTTTSVN